MTAEDLEITSYVIPKKTPSFPLFTVAIPEIYERPERCFTVSLIERDEKYPVCVALPDMPKSHEPPTIRAMREPIPEKPVIPQPRVSLPQPPKAQERAVEEPPAKVLPPAPVPNKAHTTVEKPGERAGDARTRRGARAAGEPLDDMSDIIYGGEHPSKKGSEINYRRLPGDILKKLMKDVVTDGILPPESHPLHMELSRRGILEESYYRKHIRLDPGNESIKEILYHFGIEQSDAIVTKAITKFFNLAYFAATMGKHHSREEISGIVNLLYMEEKGLSKKYAEVARHAYEKGQEYFTDRMDWTDLLILLEVPACYRT